MNIAKTIHAPGLLVTVQKRYFSTKFNTAVTLIFAIFSVWVMWGGTELGGAGCGIWCGKPPAVSGWIAFRCLLVGGCSAVAFDFVWVVPV